MLCDTERIIGLSDLSLFFLFYLLLCCFRSHLMKVVLSEHSIIKSEGVEQTFSVSAVFQHYMYNPRTFDNDIMLIKVMEHYGI